MPLLPACSHQGILPHGWRQSQDHKNHQCSIMLVHNSVWLATCKWVNNYYTLGILLCLFEQNLQKWWTCWQQNFNVYWFCNVDWLFQSTGPYKATKSKIQWILLCSFWIRETFRICKFLYFLCNKLCSLTTVLCQSKFFVSQNFRYGSRSSYGE